jgi:hypothetical protein
MFIVGARLICLAAWFSSSNNIPYYLIDNAFVAYTKTLNSLKMSVHGIHMKGVRGKSNVITEEAMEMLGCALSI